jgi:serine/threonine protein kinase
MGEVYKAKDRKLGRDVAIKVLPEEFAKDADRVARFQREAKLLASLNHNNIASIYGLEESDGTHFLVLELIEGDTLADRIKGGPIPVEESLKLALQIAEALEAAHERGVIHRDLKPANIKVTPDGKVKVLGFGLAKAFAGEQAEVNLSHSPTLSEAATMQGVILGTAAYMSPEQARGKPVDKRTDIWAFGCILYECLTGKRAFEGESVTETLAAILKGDPDWTALPAVIPPNIRFVLRRCLQKESDRRFHHAADVRIQLEEEEENGKAIISKRWSWLPWGVAAVLAAAVGISLWALWHVKPPAAEPIRFQSSCPEKQSLGQIANFAISPDGRHLVFSAEGSDGIFRVWLRSLRFLETRPLSGTEGKSSSTLFWSPDSRSIAFQSGKKLKSVDISGGAPQNICDLSGAAVGGSWNRDGVIIFGDFLASNTIMQVSAAGGKASPLMKPNPERKEDANVSPTFFQDGRHFIYFCSSSVSENTGVYIGSLNAKPEEQRPKKLITSSQVAAYVSSGNSAPGHLLFLREETLMEQPFDEKRLEPIGSAVPIEDGIGYYGSWGFFSASGSGVLVYTSGSRQLFQLTWFDRQGNVLGAEGERGRFGGLALSPNGQRAAIGFDSSSRVTPTPYIWLLDFARPSNNSPFTFEGWELNPVWSPDGSHIIFSFGDGGVRNLYQKAASGMKDKELVRKSNENKSPTDWSNDGRLLLYSEADPKTKSDLWVLPMESGGNGNLTCILCSESNERYGRFSHDMRWIAYVSDESGSDEVWVRGFSQARGAAPSGTAGRWHVPRGGGTEPRWRKDGKELYYRASEGRVMVVEVAAGTEFQARTPRPLFKVPPEIPTIMATVSLSSWDATSEGSRFLFPVSIGESSTPPFDVVLNWTSLLNK